MRYFALFVLWLLVLEKAHAQAVNRSGEYKEVNGRYYDAAGNEYLYIDARLIRGVIGYTEGSLDFDAPGKSGNSLSIPARHWRAVYLRNEFRLVSGLFNKYKKFVLRDALYLDLSLGALTSKPLTYADGSREDIFTANSSFGYQLLAGYRNASWALLAGADVLWASSFAGSAFDPDELLRNYVPLVARAEYRPWGGNECRIIACAFSNFSKSNVYYGGFLDLPLSKSKRFYITLQYQLRNTRMTVVNYNTYPARIAQWMIGFKVGSIY